MFATGNSMDLAGIADGDVLIFRSCEHRDPRNGDIVLAHLEEGATVKRLALRGREAWIVPESTEDRWKPRRLVPGDRVVGVLVYPRLSRWNRPAQLPGPPVLVPASRIKQPPPRPRLVALAPAPLPARPPLLVALPPRAWTLPKVPQRHRFPRLPVSHGAKTNEARWLAWGGEVGLQDGLTLDEGRLALVSEAWAWMADYCVMQGAAGMEGRGIHVGDLLLVRALRPAVYQPGMVVLADLGDWGATCVELDQDVDGWWACSNNGPHAAEMRVAIDLNAVLGLVFRSEAAGG